jgi:hypothetical protein
MGDAWFTEMADELARCLVDARHCAEAGEALLDSVARSDPDVQQIVLDALVGPVAVSRVLIDLIDHPPQLAVAAARLLADTAEDGAVRLEALGDRVAATGTIAALRQAAESARRLVDVAS